MSPQTPSWTPPGIPGSQLCCCGRCERSWPFPGPPGIVQRRLIRLPQLEEALRVLLRVAGFGTLRVCPLDGGDILCGVDPNLHLTEEGKEQAMERIRQIQLAAQGDQRDQLLLERALPNSPRRSSPPPGRSRTAGPAGCR